MRKKKKNKATIVLCKHYMCSSVLQMQGEEQERARYGHIHIMAFSFCEHRKKYAWHMGKRNDKGGT